MCDYCVHIQHECILGEGQPAQDITTHFTVKDLAKAVEGCGHKMYLDTFIFVRSV